MKKKDLITNLEALNSLKGLEGAKLNYAIAKNKRVLQTEIDDYKEALKPSERITELDAKQKALVDNNAYEKARLELCKEHAEKDENGNPKVKGNEYIIADQEAFKKALEAKQEELKEDIKILEDGINALKEEYDTDISDREKQIKDFEVMLEEDFDEDNIYKISVKEIPDNITTEQMEILYPFIS